MWPILWRPTFQNLGNLNLLVHLKRTCPEKKFLCLKMLFNDQTLVQSSKVCCCVLCQRRSCKHYSACCLPQKMGRNWLKNAIFFKKVTRNGIKRCAKINLSRVRVWLSKWDMSNKLFCFGWLMFLLILSQKNHKLNIKKHQKNENF